MRVFFTSDTHFGHSNILKYEPKRLVLGSTIEEHDANLLDRINRTVKPDDLLIILGDFGFANITEIREMVRAIRCRKGLVIGNHDRLKMIQWLSLGMEFACYEMTIKIAKERVRLHHMPYRRPWWKALLQPEKYREKRPVDDGRWLLHGHIHSGGHREDGSWKVRGRQINVGVDVSDYYPVPLEAIANIIGEAAKPNHRRVIEGYQPVGPRLNTNRPPQGGSGVKDA